MKPYQLYTRRVGFTLIELLVVIAIIALLIGILLPALGAARDSAQDLKCQTNVRSNGQAMSMYGSDNKGWLPLIPVESAQNPNPSREQRIDRQGFAGGLAGFYSLKQVGDAQWDTGPVPAMDGRGYVGAPPDLFFKYPNGDSNAVMSGYMSGFESLYCPRDKADSYFPWLFSNYDLNRYSSSTRQDKIPEAPSSEQDVVSYNISYLYIAGLRLDEGGMPSAIPFFGDETNTNDFALNGWYGYNWIDGEPGTESQAVLDEVGYNPVTGYGEIDNHGSEGGHFAFTDGHVELIDRNPQRTFFANPNEAGISAELRRELTREGLSIDLFREGRSRYVRTLD